MAELFKDIRYGSRMLLRTPVVSLAAILTIGLAIGGITLVAGGVYGVILRGLPFEDGDRLMRLSQLAPTGGSRRNLRVHDYVSWRERQTSFEGLAAFLLTEVNLADAEARPVQYEGTRVTASLFSEVRARPLLGRVFHEGEDAGRAPPTIILGYRVWQERYAGDLDIIGKTVRVNGIVTEIVGVMPEGFRFPFAQDVWVPLGVDPLEVPRGQGPRLIVVGRLARDVSPTQAEAQMVVISDRLATEYPETTGGLGAAVRSYTGDFMPAEIIGLLWVEVAAALGVLIIACANVANLLLARATARVKEMAIRTAMGASRARIIRQLMVEATIIAMIGGILGLALAAGLTRELGGFMEIIERPYWIEFGIETPVVLFTVAMTLVASVVAGIVPAVRASGVDVQQTLKDGSGGSSSLGVARFSTVLVVTQIATSCAVMVGAGMMIRSMMNFRSLDMGFETESVLTARVSLVGTDYPDNESRMAFYDGLIQRLVALPGVETAAFATELPGMGAGEWYLGIEGVPYATDDDYPSAHRATITSAFFTTFGVDVREGRDFSGSDRQGSLPVVIVNESFQQRYLPDGAPIGSRMRLGRSNSPNEWLTVVGVVPDLHVGDDELGGMRAGRAGPEQFYIPMAQSPQQGARIALKTRGDPLAVAALVRDAVAELDPNLPVSELDSMDGALRSVTWSFATLGWTFTIFGAIALLMAAVGLYGVIAFSVGRRTREMAIRMAVGAYRADIVKLVLAKGMKQIGVGMAIGLVFGAALARPLQLVAFRVDPNDPTVYAAIVLTLTLTGLLACLVPALRAARVDVVVAVKAE